MEQQPTDPHEAARAQELADVSVDTFLQKGTIHEALNPAISMDRLMTEGYTGDQQELQDRLSQIQREAVTEVIVPETLARMSELSLRRSGEDVHHSLIRVRSHLQNIEDGSNAIRIGMRELDDSAPRAQYALRTLQEMTYNPTSFDSDTLQRSVYDLNNFTETYDQAQRRVRSGGTEQEEAVRGATASAGTGAEAAEEGRRHFLRGKHEVEKKPENAYFDGVEEQVARRGASSVAEHQESAAKTVETNTGYMADMRDDCVELESKLRAFGSQLETVRAIDSLPRSGNLTENVYQLRSLAYRAQETGQLPSAQMNQLIEDIGRDLQRIQQGSESLHGAFRRDAAAIEAIQAKLAGILGSEAMQKAS